MDDSDSDDVDQTLEESRTHKHAVAADDDRELTSLDWTSCGDDDVVASVLSNRFFRRRYSACIGDVWTMVNPYQVNIDHSRKRSKACTAQDCFASRSANPTSHNFTGQAIWRALWTNRDQFITCIGCDGSGKSHNAREMIEQVAKHYCETNQLAELIRSVQFTTELLGSYRGSDNLTSSDSFTLFELALGSTGLVCGASVMHTMLDWSRLANRSKDEHNLRVFYAVFPDVIERRQNQWPKLRGFAVGKSLPRVLSCADFNPGPVDILKFRQWHDKLVSALELFTFSEQEIELFHDVILAIVLLGEVHFHEVSDNYQSGIYIEDESPVNIVSSLLLVEKTELMRDLISASNDLESSMYTVPQAEFNRDTLMMTLYRQLVDWTLHNINIVFSKAAILNANDKRPIANLKIIDYTGFHMSLSAKAPVPRGNSLNRLLVNTVNDFICFHALNYLFNNEPNAMIEDSVVLEQPASNLDAVQVPASSLHAVVSKFGGILVELCSMIEAGVDDLNSLQWTKCLQEDSSVRIKDGIMTINHSFGQVKYYLHDLVSCVSRVISSSLLQCLQRSERIKHWKSASSSVELFYNSLPSYSNNTFAECFHRSSLVNPSVQLTMLLLDVLTCSLKDVDILTAICLKPNSEQRPAVFDNSIVIHQMRIFRVCELIQAKKLAYPVHFSQIDFVNLFRECIQVYEIVSPFPSDTCTRMLQHLNMSGYKLGETKIFMMLEDFGRLLTIKSNISCIGTSNDVLVMDDSTQSRTVGDPDTTLASSASSANQRRRYWWNTARTTCQQHESTIASSVRRPIKLASYVIFFMTTLLCCIFSKLSLLSMLARPQQASDLDQDQLKDSILLAVIIMCPHCFINVCKAIYSLLYGTVDSSKMTDSTPVTASEGVAESTVRKSSDQNKVERKQGIIMLVFIITSCIHCVGLCLLLTLVIPLVLPITAIFLCSSFTYVPAIFTIIRLFRGPLSAPKTHAVVSLSSHMPAYICMLAILIQITSAALQGYNMVKSSSIESHLKVRSVINTGMSVITGIMISIGWWESGFRSVEAKNSLFANLSERMLARNEAIASIASLMSVLIYCALRWPGTGDAVIAMTRANRSVTAYPHEAYSGSLFQVPFTDVRAWNRVLKIENLKLVGVHVLTSVFCYITSLSSCQVLMQRLCFALPLSLATPITAMMLIDWSLGCQGGSSLSIGHLIHLDRICGKDIPLSMAAGMIITWLCQILLSAHIWYPMSRKLEKSNRIFALGHCYTPCLEQSLVFNRHSVRIHAPMKTQPQVAFGAAVQRVSAKRRDQADTNVEQPFVYICATMWHETEDEMTELIKSLLRLDKFRQVMMVTENRRKRTTRMKRTGKRLKQTADSFDFEIHIMFDDAFTDGTEGCRLPNTFVQLLASLMKKVGCMMYGEGYMVSAPVKIPTPYGGQLVWTLPGNSCMIAHLKDKQMCRHKKRWSQVMYMYYLLTYRHAVKSGCCDDNLADERAMSGSEQFPCEPITIMNNLSNTFILALDGDVDFQPESIIVLLDRMRKNESVGAACGRIYPTGEGPLIWYQRFEYAIGHWLQKAAEHKLGCVLCSPGCFSLFRGSALVDDNVLRRYASRSSNAVHYVQYDQGEDRWLCTLLLKQGYRVEYCAASHALTHAPETFTEFFNQRRRWMPSTMANIVDLLWDSRRTTQINPNINSFYIIYLGFLFVSTILGPAMIILTIASAFRTVFPWLTLTESHVLACLPALYYAMVCLTVSAPTQIKIGALLSSFYAAIMASVLVATVAQILKADELTASSIFLPFIAVLYIITGLFHPDEFTCLIHGFLYLLAIPAGYLLLVIYSFCSLHVVQWGTRESSTLASKQSEQASGKHRKELCSRLLEFVNRVRRKAGSSVRSRRPSKDSLGRDPPIFASGLPRMDNSLVISVCDRNATALFARNIVSARNYLFNPYWLERHDLTGSGSTLHLNSDELLFWQELIERYLYPIQEDVHQQAVVSRQLKDLRNKCCFVIFMMNLLWVIVQYQFEYVALNYDELLLDIGLLLGQPAGSQKVQPIGMVYMVCFVFTLLLQFFGMMLHRWSTFIEILANT